MCVCVCAGESAVEIGNGKFTWETPERSALTESVHTNTQAHTHTHTHTRMTFSNPLPSINLKVKPGQLVAIVGQVGAGKSSLLSAILGEMERVQGSVSVRVSRGDRREGGKRRSGF